MYRPTQRHSHTCFYVESKGSSAAYYNIIRRYAGDRYLRLKRRSRQPEAALSSAAPPVTGARVSSTTPSATALFRRRKPALRGLFLSAAARQPTHQAPRPRQPRAAQQSDCSYTPTAALQLLLYFPFSAGISSSLGAATPSPLEASDNGSTASLLCQGWVALAFHQIPSPPSCSGRRKLADAVLLSFRRNITVLACSHAFTIGRFRRRWGTAPPHAAQTVGGD